MGDTVIGIDILLRPILSSMASKFLYPEIVHPKLLKMKRGKEWKKTREAARRVVKFYNRPENKAIPWELKIQLAFEMVKEQLAIQGIEVKDHAILEAIIPAVTAEKVRTDNEKPDSDSIVRFVNRVGRPGSKPGS